jgi:putative phosphoribosyl transferase
MRPVGIVPMFTAIATNRERLMRFTDRIEAGKRLAEQLPPVDPGNAVVVALPRGGVPVGAVIADQLGIPLDVIIVRKVGAPGQPELAVGAVSEREGMQVTVNREIAAALGLSDQDVERLAEAQLPVIERRQKEYFGDRKATPLRGKTVIVVDDGVATGATARAALRIVRREHPARIILALPVAPDDTLALLAKEADEVVCVDTPVPFLSVGTHYRDFSQVSDAEVIDALRQRAGRGKPGTRQET